MRLAVISEASTFDRGNIFWYLKTFFVEEQAYNDPDIKYYLVRNPFQIFFKLPHWVQPKEIDAVELWLSGKKPTHLKVWVLSSGGRSTPLSGNFLENFGELLTVYENRKVELPGWVNG